MTYLTKKLIKSTLFSLLFFSFYGCAAIQLAHESKEAYRVSTSHGYQNGQEPDEIRNIKDYIVDENYFVILAEDEKKTLYKARDESLRGRLAMITATYDYCQDHGGKVVFGTQVARALAVDFDSIDFEFSSAKSDYKKYRNSSYDGWMKCINTDDDFEIKRKDKSKYFTITHKKDQLQRYALQWFIPYNNLKEKDASALQVGIWRYESFINLAALCMLNKGDMLISNRFTQNKKMNLNNYFLQQLNPYNKEGGYILASGTISCENSEDETKNYSYDITFSKKYRNLLYTRRQ